VTDERRITEATKTKICNRRRWKIRNFVYLVSATRIRGYTDA
jgi:hypothetical protein